jgi:hypothetical protein
MEKPTNEYLGSYSEIVDNYLQSRPSKYIFISFELTMPNKGSWNGKWTGENKKYFIIKKLSKKQFESIQHFKDLKTKGYDNYYYSWDDGWGANIKAELVNSIEATQRKKQSNGFCGYEWMVESIFLYGYIKTKINYESR